MRDASTAPSTSDVTASLVTLFSCSDSAWTLLLDELVPRAAGELALELGDRGDPLGRQDLLSRREVRAEEGLPSTDAIGRRCASQ